MAERVTTGQLLAALLSVLVPSWCAGCDEPDSVICTACRGAVAGTGIPVEPVTTTVVTPPTYSALPYSGAVREVIVAWKDHDRPALERHLAPAMALAMAAALAAQSPQPPPGQLWLVPVPSSASARRRRGRDPVTALARRASALVAGTPRLAPAWAQHRITVAPVLRMRRTVRDQVGLSAAQRAENLAGALEVTPWIGRHGLLAGQVCLLVDDVVTTGASIAEAAATLVAAGACCLGAATVAATPLSTSPGPHPVGPAPQRGTSSLDGHTDQSEVGPGVLSAPGDD